MVDRKLGESFAVQDDLAVFESLDEARVVKTLSAKRTGQTNSPQSAECALLEAAIAVRVLTSLDDGFLTLLHGGTLHTTVTLGHLMKLLGAAMPMNTTCNTHDRRGLNVWEQKRDVALIARRHHFRAVQTLLALALLLEKMAATIALECETAGAGLADSFLSAAMGLEFRHKK